MRSAGGRLLPSFWDSDHSKSEKVPSRKSHAATFSMGTQQLLPLSGIDAGREARDSNAEPMWPGAAIPLVPVAAKAPQVAFWHCHWLTVQTVYLLASLGFTLGGDGQDTGGTGAPRGLPPISLFGFIMLFTELGTFTSEAGPRAGEALS